MEPLVIAPADTVNNPLVFAAPLYDKPLIIVLLAVPPERTTSLPPMLTVEPVSIPPEDTIKLPCEFTVVPLLMPFTISVPPVTVMVVIPPFVVVVDVVAKMVPMAFPPALTVSVLPPLMGGRPVDV